VRSAQIETVTRLHSLLDWIQSKILVCEVCIHFELSKPVCAPSPGQRLCCPKVIDWLCETKLTLIALAPTRGHRHR